MNFAEHLNTLSTTRLQEILACRSVDPYSQRRIHSRRDLCEFLAGALSDVNYVQEMLLRTNQPQVSIVNLCAEARRWYRFPNLPQDW